MMGRIAGIKRALSLALCVLCGLGLASASPAQDVSTSFEFNDLNGFTLGISPDTVTFENGEAKSISVFSLYHSGIRSWMIDGGDTGIISFETPAAEVNLFLRDRVANVDSVLTAYDLAGGVITGVDGTNTGWREVNLSGPVLVDRIEFANTGGGTSQYAVIDDFDFTAVFDSQTHASTHVGGSIEADGVSCTVDRPGTAMFDGG